MLAGQSLEELARAGQLVTNVHPSELAIQGSSLDLHVAWVLAGGGDQDLTERDVRKKSFTVKSGRIVTLISEEELALPKYVGGVLFAPNRQFAEEGILAINAGHIDPGYQGPINLRIINLSAKDFEVTGGMPFGTLILFVLREVDHAKETETPGNLPPYEGYEDYVSRRKTVVRRQGEAGYEPSEASIDRAIARILTRRTPGLLLIGLTFFLVILALTTMALMATQIFVQLN